MPFLHSEHHAYILWHRVATFWFPFEGLRGRFVCVWSVRAHTTNGGGEGYAEPSKMIE